MDGLKGVLAPLQDFCGSRLLTTSSENTCFFTNLDRFPSVASFSMSIRLFNMFDWIWIII